VGHNKGWRMKKSTGNMCTAAPRGNRGNGSTGTESISPFSIQILRGGGTMSVTKARLQRNHQLWWGN